MHRTIVAGLALAFMLSSLGGTALAQTEAPAEASPAAALDETSSPEVTTGTPSLAFELPRWQRVTASRGPAAREDHTWTVDERGRFAYLFGGRDGGREFGDLWRYDLARDKWKKLSPGGRAPGVRFGHSAVWAAGRGLVVFAGQRGNGFFGDLWLYDPAAARWRQLPAKGALPKPRYGSCMVVGPDGRLWISHGFTSAGRFDDTRAYNLRSQRWAVLTPDGRKPGERCLHDCFTSAAGELVLYGGQDDGAFALGDLWVMGRDRSWQRLDDPAARPRRLYAVTEAGDHAYVFGGAGEDNEPFDDLWRVDRDPLEFERVRVDGSQPSARYGATLITDAERRRLLLFGGRGASARSDVWELVEKAEPVALEAAPQPTSEAALTDEEPTVGALATGAPDMRTEDALAETTEPTEAPAADA